MSRSSEALFARYGSLYRGLVTFAGLVAFFTTVFSSTMVNVAIPHVMGAFGVPGYASSGGGAPQDGLIRSLFASCAGRDDAYQRREVPKRPFVDLARSA